VASGSGIGSKKLLQLLEPAAVAADTDAFGHEGSLHPVAGVPRRTIATQIVQVFVPGKQIEQGLLTPTVVQVMRQPGIKHFFITTWPTDSVNFLNDEQKSNTIGMSISNTSLVMS
jgi:hypothetical protein